MRRMQGELELAKQTARKEEQKRCSHMHGNGTASVAHVENLDMLQCVHCQAKIKRAPGPFDEDSMGYIYDENLFWRLLQARSQTTF